MRTLFANPPVGEDNNPIRHAHGGEPVRNEQRGLARGQLGKALEYFVL